MKMSCQFWRMSTKYICWYFSYLSSYISHEYYWIFSIGRINTNRLLKQSAGHFNCFYVCHSKIHFQMGSEYILPKWGNLEVSTFPAFQILIWSPFGMYRVTSKCLNSLSRNAKMLWNTSGMPSSRVFAGIMTAQTQTPFSVVISTVLLLNI